MTVFLLLIFISSARKLKHIHRLLHKLAATVVVQYFTFANICACLSIMFSVGILNYGWADGLQCRLSFAPENNECFCNFHQFKYNLKSRYKTIVWYKNINILKAHSVYLFCSLMANGIHFKGGYGVTLVFTHIKKSTGLNS